MVTQIKPLSILITDDIEENRKWIANILHSITPDALIEEAEDGKKAVELVDAKLKTEGRSFHLIIMDYKMPVMNGEKATKAIREVEKSRHSDKQSLIITWSSSKESPYPEADDWLPKVTSKEEMISLLSNYQLI